MNAKILLTNLMLANNHDLLSQLSSVPSVSRLLLDAPDSLSAQRRELILQSLSDNTISTYSTLLSLITVAKLAASQSSAEEEASLPFFAGDAFDYAVERVTAMHGSFAITHSFPEDLMLSFNEFFLRQAFIALLSDSVMRAPKTPERHFTISETNSDIIISLADGGTAIGDDVLDEVKEDKYYNEICGDWRHGGTARLMMCRAIALAHGGELFVANRDHGVIYTLQIPKRT